MSQIVLVGDDKKSCQPIGIFFSTAGEDDVEEDLLEMPEGELRGILHSVTSDEVIAVLPYFSTLNDGWQATLQELCQTPPAGSVVLQPPKKKALKKAGLKHLL